MDILFNAKTFGEQVMEQQIEAYTQAISSIYNTLKDGLDLSLLNSIIIPEDYKEGLFDFQKLNGHSEFITENEYGRGMAQVVSSKNDKEEIVYNIVIDKNLIFTLVGEEQLEAVKNNFNSQEDYDQFISTRQCWSEYFACRIASKSFPFDESVVVEIVETCNNAEGGLQKQRSKYNRRKIEIEEFVPEFHNYTNFILKKIACAHGNLYCLNDSREKIVDAVEAVFGDAYIKAIWKDYGNALDELYIQYPKWESDAIFNDLCNLFIKYYEQYEIFISETSKGTYYDIPVRL